MKRLPSFSALLLVALTGARAQKSSLGGTNAGPTFLTGKIVMQDESPLPDGVNILEVCSGRPRLATFTDRKGQFSFQVGRRDPLDMPDLDVPGASANGNLRPVGPPGGGPMVPPSSELPGSSSAAAPISSAGSSSAAGLPLLGCELRADLPGYRSSAINLDGHRPSDNPAVGTIVLTRLANVGGVSVSATSLKAPANAQKAYDQGLDSLRKAKPADAEKDFEKAVGIYPQYANAWIELGKLRLQRKATEPARDAFQKALEADDKLVVAHVELGTLAAQQSQWEDAVKHLDVALQLDPVDFPRAWFMDAVAYFNLKNLDGAEKNAREAVKLDPKHTNPDANRLLGLTLASKGNFSEAAEELKTFIELAPAGTANLEQVKGQLAQIEKMAAAGKPAAQTQP